MQEEHVAPAVPTGSSGSLMSETCKAEAVPSRTCGNEIKKNPSVNKTALKPFINDTTLKPFIN
jgi:hypothetical protein